MNRLLLVTVSLMFAGASAMAAECSYRGISQRGVKACDSIFADRKAPQARVVSDTMTIEKCAELAYAEIGRDMSYEVRDLVDRDGRSVNFEAAGMSRWDIQDKIDNGQWSYKTRTVNCSASRASFDFNNGTFSVQGSVRRD